ncbi:MAG: Smr/MutS family protein [Gemmatimonadota bacterium]|nr:Smr/MutS family protein [Gemmatimonadota bacterium]
MPDRALQVLEFGRVLEFVAGFASTAAGREMVRGLRPSSSTNAVRARLNAVAETVRFLEPRGDWGLPAVPDARSDVARLEVEGSVLPAAGLARLGGLLAAGHALDRALNEGADGLPVLEDLRTRLLVHPRLQASIERSVDPDGTVLDGASRELGRIRARLRGAHNRVVQHLEGLLTGIDERYRVPEASVSIREGRYVIPVRREGRRVVGGYVHDESSSGATVFVEPPSAIEEMNRVRELERAEVREVRRILRELTERSRSLARELAGSLAALTLMDARVALARAGARWEGTVPEVTESLAETGAGGGICIRRGRHPLLATGGTEAVPFDLELDARQRVVVVTGPNTGGKTVFLKSVGLIASLAQSGVVPPVGPGTRIPAFDSFYADVGDEQSIADSLSTFSAHLRNLQDVLLNAGPRSLVLIDEPGAGTDPREGEALARALIETLAERGGLAVVTSHMGGLKRLAAPGNGIVNASLEFDGDRLAPTYRFATGRPGRSYGLAIARGLGFPDEVLNLADGYRDRAEARLDDLLETLQRKERRVSRLLDALENERRRARDLEAELATREAVLRRSEREAAARARREARRMLLEARREVEAAITGLQDRERDGVSEREAARRARRTVEEAARALEDPAPDGAGPPRDAGGPDAPELEAGAAVRMSDTGAEGTVLEVEGDRVAVLVGGVRMRVPRSRLGRVRGGGGRGGGGDARKPPRWSGGIADPATEVDLRGQRADEAEMALCRALDGAAVADLRELRVIHGLGTGALRKRVSEVLARDARVEDFRAGRPGEGGHGVTVVRIR